MFAGFGVAVSLEPKTLVPVNWVVQSDPKMEDSPKLEMDMKQVALTGPELFGELFFSRFVFFGFPPLSIFLAICGILELEAAISTAFATCLRLGFMEDWFSGLVYGFWGLVLGFFNVGFRVRVYSGFFYWLGIQGWF